MSIASKVNAYLDKTHIDYQLLQHRPSNNTLSSAIKANITASQIVKAVVLEDLENRKLMAILPGSHKISLSALNKNLNRHFHIVKESHIYELFDDCKPGAVPPLAQAYNMERVYDESLLQQALLYLEGGDHTSLIQVDQEEFRKLMQDSSPMSFSYQLFQ